MNTYKACKSATMTMKGGNHVDYSSFKKNKLILRKDIIVPEGVNNYRMTLKTVDNESERE